MRSPPCAQRRLMTAPSQMAVALPSGATEDRNNINSPQQKADVLVAAVLRDNHGSQPQARPVPDVGSRVAVVLWGDLGSQRAVGVDLDGAAGTVAVVLQGDRGSQPVEGDRVDAVAGLGGGRPGATVDRNLYDLYKAWFADVVMVVLRGDRGSQRCGGGNPAGRPGSGGRRPGRPWIATTSRSPPAGNGSSWWSPFRGAVDRNSIRRSVRAGALRWRSSSGRPWIAAPTTCGRCPSSWAWRSSCGATVDRNLVASGPFVERIAGGGCPPGRPWITTPCRQPARNRASRSGGRPLGRPRIATTAAAWCNTNGHRGGRPPGSRGSQRPRVPWHAAAADRWRLPSGGTVDRNITLRRANDLRDIEWLRPRVRLWIETSKWAVRESLSRSVVARWCEVWAESAGPSCGVCWGWRGE